MNESGESPSLRDLGEEELVARLVSGLPTAPPVLVGPGDDCAVFEWDPGAPELALFKTDALVEGIHFEPGTPAAEVGRKALSRTVSDVAAMGGRPLMALVTLATDAERQVSEVEGWYRGIREAACRFSCAIVGGETTTLPSPGALLSIALLGVVGRAHCLTRSGGRVGDVLAVTGRLGDSFRSRRHLTFVPRIEEGEWLARSGKVTAMMDLSDGLGSDLPRLAEASGVGYRIERERIPRHEGVSIEEAVSDGEDYELLFSVRPDAWETLAGDWEREFPDCQLSRIGQFSDKTATELSRGWEHYRN